MSSNPIGAELAIREAVKIKLDSTHFDKIIGQPTIKSWKHLKEQASKAAAQVKTTYWGGQHGHLALVLNNLEFR